MANVQEQFDAFFGVDSVICKSKRDQDVETGRQLCRLGVPHSASWNDDVTQGYREQEIKENEREQTSKHISAN